MCIRESFIQGSGFALVILSLKMPRFAVWDPVMETSIPYSFSIKVHEECVDCSSCVLVRIHPFLSFRVKVSLQMCCTSVRNLNAIQHQSSYHSIHPNSSCRSVRQDSIPHESTTSQWYKPVPSGLIPDFPSLFLISSFQDLWYPFSVFYRCLSLWNLGSHLWFLRTSLWICHCSICSFLCL